MEVGLYIFLIVIANLTLYWIFVGQRKFNEKMKIAQEKEGDDNGREIPRRRSP